MTTNDPNNDQGPGGPPVVDTSLLGYAVARLEKMMEGFSRTWSEERESLYSAMNKLRGDFMVEIKGITDRLSQRDRPNWMLVAIIISIVTTAGAVGLWAVNSTIAPIAVRVAELGEDQDQMREDLKRTNEMTIRNDERWSLYLNGHLRNPAYQPATMPAN